MTEIKPITPTEPACLGVVCAEHEHCTRWHAAEGNPVHTIGTCVDGDGGRVLFVDRRKLERQPAENAQP